MSESTRAAGTVAALNLRAMAEQVTEARDRIGNGSGHIGKVQADTLLHAWAALTGMDDPAEAYELARSIVYHDGPAGLLTGEDLYTNDQYLVTIWPEGPITVARRADSYAPWGLPTDLHPAP